MSKKQRRSRSQSMVAPVEKPRNEPAQGPNPALRRQPTVFEFNPDYSHVKSDLNRIGILAGSFVVILVVLSFILK